MTRKTVQKYPEKWQAQILVERLQEVNIQASIIFTPREYASVITGIGHGEYTVDVDQEDYEKALQLEIDFRRKENLSLVQDTPSTELAHPEKIKPDSFRRMMSCVLLSILLPVLFHLAATILYVKLLKQKVSPVKKITATFFLIACWAFLYYQLSYLVYASLE